MLAVLRSDRNGKHSTFSLVHGTLHPIHANPLEVIVLLSLYLAVLDDQSKEEQFIDRQFPRMQITFTTNSTGSANIFNTSFIGSTPFF